MFVLLYDRIFVREDIKQIFLELGDIVIICRGVEEGRVLDKKSILKKEGTLKDIENIFNLLNRFSNFDKNKIYPNSKKCIHLEIRKGNFNKDNYYKVCTACDDKLCSDVFGREICLYNYKEKNNDVH